MAKQSYITTTEVKEYLGVTWNTSFDTFIESFISAAGNYIDRACSNPVGSRWFSDDNVSQTRYFNGNGQKRLYLDDVRSIKQLQINLTVGQGVTLVENTDFYMYPMNAQNDGMPYEWIELIQPTYNRNVNSRIAALAGNNPFVFWKGQRNVIVTGTWGFATTAPDDIKVATMKLVSSFIKENIGDTDIKEVTSEKLGNFGTSYTKISSIADRVGVTNIIAPYVRKFVFETSGGIRKLD